VNNITIGQKINIATFIISIISLIFGALFLTWNGSQTEEKVYQQFIKDLKTETLFRLQTKKDVGISNAVSIANDIRIQEALKENDREKAISSLKSLSINLNHNTPFKNVKVHIHTKDNHSFVRAWKLDKHGDNLSAFRKSIVSVNKKLMAVNTFEIGKAGLSLRSVVPVLDEKSTHLGSLEFIQGINSVAKSFYNNSDGFMLLMDTTVSQVKQFKKEKVFQEKYLISQKFLTEEFLEDAKTINMNSLLNNAFVISKKYLYTHVNIKDFKGKNLGIALVGAPLAKVNLAIDISKDQTNIALIIMVILILLILFSVMILLRIAVINPISKFQKGLLNFFDYLNRKHEYVEKLEVVDGDEIGKMAELVNQNIEKIQLGIEQDQQFIRNVSTVINNVNDGNFHHQITV
jgi:methyl-accepting chemotaxis protein